MDTAQRNLIACQALMEVYREGAYSSLKLNETVKDLSDEKDRAFVTRLFYGVISKTTQFDYIISRLAPKKPKPVVTVVLRMGLYMLRYMNTPAYATIDTQVELIKKLGKKELAGFVNALLRRSQEIILPVSTGDKLTDISVNCSCPLWLVKKLSKQYGLDFTQNFLSAQTDSRVHVRVNTDKISEDAFSALVQGASKSAGGFYADYAKLKSVTPSLYTVQSLSSVLATRFYAKGVEKGAKVLDTCAAPGGKAVYLASLLSADVTACDIHEHRVKLIRSYAERMGVKIKAIQNDATLFCEQFEGKFDLVVCDAPCSGIGVIHSKPDILLSRKPEDISELADLQYNVLSTSSKYVKAGGQLNYSTCTILKEENERVVQKFLQENEDFELVPVDGKDYTYFFPHTDGCDGFFMAKIRRKR